MATRLKEMYRDFCYTYAKDRARVEEGRLSQRLREQELKGTVMAAHLREAEQRAKVLETGAIAARRRAELGTQKVRTRKRDKSEDTHSVCHVFKAASFG